MAIFASRVICSFWHFQHERRVFNYSSFCFFCRAEFLFRRRNDKKKDCFVLVDTFHFSFYIKLFGGAAILSRNKRPPHFPGRSRERKEVSSRRKRKNASAPLFLSLVFSHLPFCLSNRLFLSFLKNLHMMVQSVIPLFMMSSMKRDVSSGTTAAAASDDCEKCCCCCCCCWRCSYSSRYRA